MIGIIHIGGLPLKSVADSLIQLHPLQISLHLLNHLIQGPCPDIGTDRDGPLFIHTADGHRAGAIFYISHIPQKNSPVTCRHGDGRNIRHLVAICPLEAYLDISILIFIQGVVNQGSGTAAGNHRAHSTINIPQGHPHGTDFFPVHGHLQLRQPLRIGAAYIRNAIALFLQHLHDAV